MTPEERYSFDIQGVLIRRGVLSQREVLGKYSPGNSAYNVGRPVEPDQYTRLTPRQQQLCQLPSVAGHHLVEGSGA